MCKQRVSEKIKHASIAKNNKYVRDDSDGNQKVGQTIGGLAKAESLTKGKSLSHGNIFHKKIIRLHIGHVTCDPFL